MDWLASVIAPPTILAMLFGLYGVLGILTFLLYRGLSPEAEAGTVRPPAPLGPSRGTVYRLAALFSVDAFGGGLLVNALLALWLSQRFEISISTVESIFFVTSLCSAVSYFAAVPLARRFGLVNTMVWSFLSQMDVPTRSSYVMAVGERPAAASVTAVPRILASFLAPLLSGWLLTLTPFLNLVNNAIKFTPAGQVTVSVGVDSRSETGALKFSVRDTGIGIPHDKQDRLFQRFSQVDGSAHRQFGGTGLGLAISKSLVELMAGDIGVMSEPGQGSTFWFSLPLAEVKDADSGAVTQGDHEPIRVGRILLAEDVEINQEIITTLLTSAGHDVDVVSNGAEAIEAVQRKPYDLVLMDIQMPHVDGIQATEQIRALKAGMNDHVGKPIDRTKLRAVIARWLCTVPVAGEDRGHEITPSTAAFDRKVYEELAELMGEGGVARLLAQLRDQLNAYPPPPEQLASLSP